jgi:site-specific DNA-methyltransferase (adenine-specific)
MELGFRLHDTMIYRKTNGGANGSRKAYLACWEYMFVFSKGEPLALNLLRDRKNKTPPRVREESAGRRHVDGEKKGKRIIERHEYGLRWNVWDYAVGGRSCGDKAALTHPAIFPEALARDHILSWSNEGDIVLDPFNGSGTTAKMAKHNGRRYIGIEVNAEYCEIAEKRLMQ